MSLQFLYDLDWMVTLGYAALALQFFLAAGVILRVILTRHPPGSAFAWILLTVILPYAGFVLYVTVGERPIGRWRAFKMKAALARWESAVAAKARSRDPEQFSQRHRGLVRLAEKLGDIPMSQHSALELISDTSTALSRIAQDIRQAGRSVLMEFYIWNAGGLADTVAQELIAAARRGIVCKVLVDAVGSREFLASDWPARLRAAGVHLCPALPVRFFGPARGRADLRLHRKTIIIDDTIGYTGSLNLVDPRYFKQAEGIGEWVDAMARIEGSAVADLQLVFHFDWALQPDDTGRRSEPTDQPVCSAKGQARVVVVPSGPTTLTDANLRLIIEAINCARVSIHITTPYFVPGEALAMALQNAAYRGVRVHLCVPQHNDSALVHWASRRYFEGLMASGVTILSFCDGLLHTKAITIDEEFAVFGTVNLDNRSMHLNFEMMLLIFDRQFVGDLVALQLAYEQRSGRIDPVLWHQRSLTKRLAEGLCYLLSPLL